MLAICCLSLFIVGLDVTIINVAVPAIGRDFHAPVSGLQWTIDAYLLVIASLLMLSGSTADRVGRRRVFQIGLAVFTVGSLACSLAPSLGALIAFRALQAVGGSMLNPVAMAIITNTFTEPGERAKAIGAWGSVFGLSMALGPIIGGALVDSVGWRGVFWVNIPIGVAAIILTALFVPESRAGTYRRPDPFGQILVMITLGTVTYGIIEGPDYGWASARILACFAVGAVALAAFLWHEPRRDEPLLDLRFFRSLAVLRRGADRGDRAVRVRRIPVPDHAVPAGRARLPAADRRAVPAADGAGDGLLGAAGRTRDRAPRHADPADHLRCRDRGRRPAADVPDRDHAGVVRAAVRRGVRRRAGLAERPDHQQRGRGDAQVAGGRRGRDRVDGTAGRLLCSAWR